MAAGHGNGELPPEDLDYINDGRSPEEIAQRLAEVLAFNKFRQDAMKPTTPHVPLVEEIDVSTHPAFQKQREEQTAQRDAERDRETRALQNELRNKVQQEITLRKAARTILLENRIIRRLRAALKAKTEDKAPEPFVSQSLSGATIAIPKLGGDEVPQSHSYRRSAEAQDSLKDFNSKDLDTTHEPIFSRNPAEDKTQQVIKEGKDETPAAKKKNVTSARKEPSYYDRALAKKASEIAKLSPEKLDRLRALSKAYNLSIPGLPTDKNDKSKNGGRA